MAIRQFIIGRWRVDPALNRAILKGDSVAFEPRLMKLLVILSESHGEVVLKDDLLDLVWEDLNVTEESLTQAISQLRKILAADPATEVFIQTVSKKGYMLVPEVRFLDKSKKTLILKVAALSFSALAVLGIFFWGSIKEKFFGSEQAPLVSFINPLPLTSEPGREKDPDISFDGSLVVYSAETENKEIHIFLHARGAGSPDRQLTTYGNNLSPRFFPDGKNIAFMRKTSKGCQIIFMDLLSGGERALGNCMNNRFPDLAISPDGTLLAFSAKNEEGGPNAVFVFDAETKNIKKISRPEKDSWGDFDPVFVPGKNEILFSRAYSEAMQDIFKVNLEDLTTTQITKERRNIFGIGVNDNRVVFSSNRQGPYRLWFLDEETSEIKPFPLAGSEVVNPSFSLDGNTLIFEIINSQGEFNQIILPVQDSQPDLSLGNFKPFEANLFHPDFSPSGETIVFTSDRSGFYEIWEAQTDGSGFRKLTSFEGGFTAYPQYSPDGKQIAFSAQREGVSQIFILGLDGALLELTADEFSAFAPTWSKDGNFLYFSSNKNGLAEIWRMSISGGEPEQITKGGGMFGRESSEGSLYVVRPARNGLWKMNFESPEIFELVLPDLTLADWGNWALGEKFIYYYDRVLNLVKAFDLENGQDTGIFSPTKNVPYSDPILTLSEGETILLFGVLSKVESDLFFGDLSETP